MHAQQRKETACQGNKRSLATPPLTPLLQTQKTKARQGPQRTAMWWQAQRERHMACVYALIRVVQHRALPRRCAALA